MYRLTDVTKDYPKGRGVVHALRGVNVVIEDGDWLAIQGPTGQRVAIARALVKRPAVLLADEPTGNLDEDTRDEIMTLLEDLWRDRDLTLVTVTHDSSVARRAQQTAIMRNGLLTLRDSAPARHLGA
jgi:ABC-type lipoprotein export system ATPase subunit